TPFYPGSRTAGTIAFAVAFAGGVAVIAATALRRGLAAHIAMGILLIGSLAVAYSVLSAPLPQPGWAVDAATGVPVGTAFPGHLVLLPGRVPRRRADIRGLPRERGGLPQSPPGSDPVVPIRSQAGRGLSCRPRW